MILFLDANVLLAAAATPEGRIQALFRFADQGLCGLSSSRYAIEEATRNIAVKLPQATAELDRLLEQITVVKEAAPNLVAEAHRHLPFKDAPILAAAVEAGADLLVTGDKRHFGTLFNETLDGVTVVTPTEALKRILEEAI